MSEQVKVTTHNLFPIELPVRGKSRRVTRREIFDAGETCVLFDEEGPGCLLHWWLTYPPLMKDETKDRAHDMQLRIFYDGADEASVDVTLAQYFGVLLDKEPFPYNSAPLKILNKDAMNSYWPIPFKKMRIELTNNTDGLVCVWFMGNWQAYPEDYDLTPLRLRITPKVWHPAEPQNSILMDDINGQGFVAGMVKGVRHIDHSDAWFHSGGDLWYIDGETDPWPIRGVGGEDVFCQAFGVFGDAETPWVGTPYEKQAADGEPYEAIMYRFFGLDPIWFNTSLTSRFGSKANDIDTVIYSYVEESTPPAIITPSEWQLAGPFPCETDEDFERKEWAEQPMDQWPSEHTIETPRYTMDDQSATFPVPVKAVSEHGWCDFARHYRGKRRSNDGTQAVEVAAYAVGTVNVAEAGTYELRLGFDDFMKLWINGEPKPTMKHEQGYQVIRMPVQLHSGENEIRVKLSNNNNFQWRLWAFNLAVKKS